VNWGSCCRLCGLSRTSHFDWAKLLPDINFLALPVLSAYSNRARHAAGANEEGPEEEGPTAALSARQAIWAILRGEDRQTLVKGLVRLGCAAISDGAGDADYGSPWKFEFEEFVKAERARDRGRVRMAMATGLEGGDDEEDQIKEDEDDDREEP
jgi:hypothetical protein